MFDQDNLILTIVYCRLFAGYILHVLNLVQKVFWGARVAQLWERSPPTSVARVRFPDPASCGLSLSLVLLYNNCLSNLHIQLRTRAGGWWGWRNRKCGISRRTWQRQWLRGRHAQQTVVSRTHCTPPTRMRPREITAFMRVHVLTVKSHDKKKKKEKRCWFKGVCLGTRQDEMINST